MWPSILKMLGSCDVNTQWAGAFVPTAQTTSSPPTSYERYQYLQMTYQYDNEFLLSHYRPVSNSYHACLSSLCYLHNQTGNIYSHLFGVVLFLFWAHQTYYDLAARYSTSDQGDILAFGVFFAGAIICFGLSATFHILGSHSQRVYHTWLLLDLYGIFVIMVATVFSATFYGFYCERFWWKFYSIGVGALLSTHEKRVLI